MKLTSLFQPDLTFWDVDISTKEEMYELVAGNISKCYNLQKETISAAFAARDKLGGTALEGGIAIPHGRIDNLDDLIIAIVKPKIPFKNDHEDDTSIFFFMLTSNEGSNIYLKALRAFAFVALSFIETSFVPKSAEDLIDYIDGHNIHLNEIVKISDIITNNPVVAHKTDTISEIVDIMKKSNLTFLPVIDEKEKYIGRINLVDIMKIAYPEYILEMTDLSFLTNFRAYEEFFEKEKKILVESAFVTDDDSVKTIRDDASIIELSFLLIKNSWSHITVIDEKNEVVGVASLRDILNKILRA